MPVILGDCREVMATMEAASVDAVVTDPPYHLTQVSRGGSPRTNDPETPFGRTRLGSVGFMGKTWDGGGVAFEPGTWLEALRVLKPGGHLLAFGGTRTFHRLTCAIEDAGFEIRDCCCFLYGSGFPKSLDVSKAIDKAAGCEPRVAGGVGSSNTASLGTFKPGEAISGEAIRWSGFGTALKPAWEPVILARKPLDSTVAACVQKHGTGAINVDGCRIGFAGNADRAVRDAKNPGREDRFGGEVYGGSRPQQTPSVDAGRWPANVLLDEEAARMLDEQSGPDMHGAGHERPAIRECAPSGNLWKLSGDGNRFGDSGGASRFFYTSKASRWDREDGLEGIPKRRVVASVHGDMGDAKNPNHPRSNSHPTVKPTDLMRWLCRLVTPPGGLVLDPFCGSGSTGVAAEAEGFRFIGIEMDPEYVEIAKRRIANVAPLFEDEVAP